MANERPGLDKATYPALWQFLYGEPSHPCSCDECPISTREPSPNNLFHDPEKAYFRCTMVDLIQKGIRATGNTRVRDRSVRKASRVWGKSPDCLLIDWKDLAKLDLERVLMAWQSALNPQSEVMPR